MMQPRLHVCSCLFPPACPIQVKRVNNELRQCKYMQLMTWLGPALILDLPCEGHCTTFSVQHGYVRALTRPS